MVADRLLKFLDSSHAKVAREPVSYQLSEIAGLLESRLGESNELAVSARNAQQEFAKFAHLMRRRVALSETTRPESDSQTA